MINTIQSMFSNVKELKSEISNKKRLENAQVFEN